MGFCACVWDLDGTLFYTLSTIHYYCNRSLRHFGLREISLDACQGLCRLSIGEFYKKLLVLGGCPSGDIECLAPLIRDYQPPEALAPYEPAFMAGAPRDVLALF